MPGKLNVERRAGRIAKLLMHGGTLPKRISVDFRIVGLASRVHHTIANIQVAVAISALTQTITHLTKGGRFRQAADREKEIGQIYLQETNDLQKACQSFERAGEWYAQEDATA